MALLHKELPNPSMLMSYRLHQQNECTKYALLGDALKGVISIVNYIRANARQHRKFRQLLQFHDETFSVDLLHHSKVRW